MDYRVVSIGALSRHELWDEGEAVRSPHATTVLIRTDERCLLVDPGLPRDALAARLHERSGLGLDAVTDVFLTNFRPAHRRALPALPHARWLIAEAEREGIGQQLVARFQQETDESTREALKEEIDLLQRTEAAPDRIEEGLDIFPLPGFTPGTCGLLISEPRRTVLVAGDAAATREHVEHGRVLRGAEDAKQARESLAEVIEIADVLFPGHDNIMLNPTRMPL